MLAVKKNQPTTYDVFQYLWASTLVDGTEHDGLSVHDSDDAATHGRRERRRVLAFRIADLDWVGRCAVAHETVTGLFRANNPAGFARAVADALDLKADITGQEVRLSRPADGGSV